MFELYIIATHISGSSTKTLCKKLDDVRVQSKDCAYQFSLKVGEEEQFITRGEALQLISTGNCFPLYKMTNRCSRTIKCGRMTAKVETTTPHPDQYIPGENVPLKLQHMVKIDYDETVDFRITGAEIPKDLADRFYADENNFVLIAYYWEKKYYGREPLDFFLEYLRTKSV